MPKYKLTVKYDGVCDLSIAGDIPNIIANEFDQYVKSMLYKKEEWENFEANFKVAAKQEYTNQKKEAEKLTEENKDIKETDVPAQNIACTDDAPVLIEKEAAESACEPACESASEPACESKNTSVGEPKENDDKENSLDGFPVVDEIAPLEEITAEKPAEDSKENKDEGEGPTIKVEIKNEKILPFEKFIENKKISSALDEFVAGACYLDEILNIKEFSLKEINAKLFPAFGRLASSAVINQATERVLIETIKKSGATKYKINENAWNYHNYDLVRH